jgi:hypothetical protein
LPLAKSVTVAQSQFPPFDDACDQIEITFTIGYGVHVESVDPFE